MRIIKEEELSDITAQISPMIFPDFPEGGKVNIDGNGGLVILDDEPVEEQAAPKEPEIDIEQIKQEAEQIRAAAVEDGEQIRAQAQKEVEAAKAQAQQELEQLRAQVQQESEGVKKEAYSNGYSSGSDEGYKKGYEDGFVKGKNAAIEETVATISMMKEVVDQLKGYHSQVLDDSQTDIAKMALSVARKVLHKEIMTDPMTVVGVVRNALAKVSYRKKFVIFVNPLDLEVIQGSSAQVKDALDGYDSLDFKASPKVEAGGCVVQTESGNVDAQVDRQMNEVEQAVMRAMGETA